MLKKEARKIFRQKRLQLSAAERMKFDDLLLIQFQRLQLPFLNLALSFYPAEEYNEVNTFIFSDYLQFKNPGLQIAYPKINVASGSMQAVVCEETEGFEKNFFNIHEPVNFEAVNAKEIDLVLVPLLAFDRRGYRVGYGKGFYDRFLKECREDCIKIGLSYFEAVEAIDDANEFDVPLDFCITPQEAYVF